MKNILCYTILIMMTRKDRKCEKRTEFYKIYWIEIGKLNKFERLLNI